MLLQMGRKVYIILLVVCQLTLVLKTCRRSMFTSSSLQKEQEAAPGDQTVLISLAAQSAEGLAYTLDLLTVMLSSMHQSPQCAHPLIAPLLSSAASKGALLLSTGAVALLCATRVTRPESTSDRTPGGLMRGCATMLFGCATAAVVAHSSAAVHSKDRAATHCTVHLLLCFLGFRP